MTRLNRNATDVDTNAIVEQFDGNEVQSPVIMANDDIDAEVPSVADAIEMVETFDEGDIQVGANASTRELDSSHDEPVASNSMANADDESQVAPQIASETETQSGPVVNTSKTRSKADDRILKLPVIIEMQRNAPRGVIVTPRGVVEIAKSDKVTTTARGVVVFASGYSSNGKGNIRIYVEPKDPEDINYFYNQMSLAVMCAQAGKPVPLFPWSKAKVVY